MYPHDFVVENRIIFPIIGCLEDIYDAHGSSAAYRNAALTFYCEFVLLMSTFSVNLLFRQCAAHHTSVIVI